MRVMQIKAVIIGLIALLYALYLPAAETVRHGHGLLWQIDKPGMPTCYVLGTMHSSDPRILDIPAPVTQALGRSQQFVMEMELTYEAMTKLMTRMYFSGKDNLQSMLPAQLYQRTVKAAAGFGLPEAVVNSMKPWALATTFSMPSDSDESAVFLDMKLSQMAYLRPIPVFGLESADEQLAVFDDMSVQEQIDFLESTLDELPNMPRYMEEMTNAYLQRNLQAIVEMSSEQMEKASDPLQERLQSELVDKRNLRMVERMEPLMKKAPTFVAVGALHLPGPTGILELLEARGYQVKALY